MDLETTHLVLPTCAKYAQILLEGGSVYRDTFASLIVSTIFQLPCATRERNLLLYQCYFYDFDFH